MALTSTERLTDYEAALQGAAFLARPDAGYVRLAGPDRADYLQRQTTNDVSWLTPERAVLTVLTSPTGRIYDVLLLLAEPEAIGILTLPGRGAATAAYFQGHIFFNDKVTVADASAEFAQFELDGPRAPEALAALGLAQAPGPDGVAAFDFEGAALRVIGREGLAGAGYRLVAPVSLAQTASAALGAGGAVGLSPEGYDLLRVEAGLPGSNELSQDYTPLETGLERAVSGTKGCYTGQEVLARQTTYDKVTRQMAGLRLESPVMVGAQVMVEGGAVGTVTSSAQSPRFGPIALAVLRRPYHEAGSRVTVSGQSGEISGEVVSLPFEPGV